MNGNMSGEQQNNNDYILRGLFIQKILWRLIYINIQMQKSWNQKLIQFSSSIDLSIWIILLVTEEVSLFPIPLIFQLFTSPLW